MSVQQPEPILIETPISYNSVPLDSLESLRLRLTQVTHTLNKLSTEIKSSTMPQWSSLQSQLSIVLTQLSSLAMALDEHSVTLESTVAYPLPSFPTTEQEGLLTTLMRKKLSPEVTDWIKEAKENSTGAEILISDDENLMRFAIEEFEKLQAMFFQLKHGTEKQLLGAGEIKNIVVNKTTAAPSDPGSGLGNVVTNVDVDEVLKFMFQGISPEDQRMDKQRELERKNMKRR